MSATPRGAVLGAVIHADARAFLRDPLLRAMALAPIGLMGMLVVGVPLVEAWLLGSYGVDLGAHQMVVVALLTAVVLPLLFGAFAGLLLLEDRETGVLTAIAVSPAGLPAYLAIRCAWAAVATALATAGALLLGTDLSGQFVALTALLAAGSGAVVCLLTGGLATDRLEGMAVTKAMMLPLAVPLLLWAVDAPWSWLLGVAPTFGPVAVLHLTDVGGSLFTGVVVGAVSLLAWASLLWRRILRRPDPPRA